METNWSEVLEKVVAATELWLRRRLSLKGRAEVLQFAHLLPSRIPTFSASYPGHHPIKAGKDSLPVSLG